MSIKVDDVFYTNFDWESNNGIYTLKKPGTVNVHCTYNNKKVILGFDFKKGFKCDGLSVPSVFQWFIKSWDDKNDLFNLAGVVHDALYANKGFSVLDRDECDAIFRGMLREAGKSRLVASMADFAVGLAAGSHWGDDNLDCANLVTCEFIQH